MSFAVFNENLYLTNYPDVRAAVNAGIFGSGREHFERFGLREGRVLVSRFYDESFYLSRNGDVAAAVANRMFASGLEHFIRFGEAEGRALSQFFDEAWYRRRYPDVGQAIAAGNLQSGLEHYILFGEAEGRSGTPFNEFGYKDAYPDVVAAIEADILNSALEHYVNFGQFENRTGIFTGTGGNDTVTGFGAIDEIYGVDLSPGPCVTGGTVVGGECLNVQSSGINAVDVLIGGAGKDTFAIGSVTSSRIGASALRFYVSGGNADFALIKNFEAGKDRIRLAGFGLSDYLFETSNGDVNIFLAARGSFDPLPTPDLVAIVEGVTYLSDESLDFLPTSIG